MCVEAEERDAADGPDAFISFLLVGERLSKQEVGEAHPRVGSNDHARDGARASNPDDCSDASGIPRRGSKIAGDGDS
jgi:hypothetical protein